VDRTGAIPTGFQPHARTNPFLDLIGPVCSRHVDDALEFTLVIDERHVNGRGSAHGGVLAALADVALGYASSGSTTPPAHLTAASLTIDYVGPAKPGDTVVATVEIQHVGRRLAFANCYLCSEGRRVVHASAVFARTG
jgi:acyl-coenzyme A thioesterase 13